MKNEKKSDYNLNMNDDSQIYDYILITLRLITQLWFRIQQKKEFYLTLIISMGSPWKSEVPYQFISFQFITLVHVRN